MVSTDVEVKGSDLPVSGSTMSSPTLVMVKHRTMVARPTSDTNRTGTFSMSLVGEDRSEDGRHDDEEC